MKARLGKAAERMVNGLWDAIGRIIDTFSHEEVRKSHSVARVQNRGATLHSRIMRNDPA